MNTKNAPDTRLSQQARKARLARRRLAAAEKKLFDAPLQLDHELSQTLGIFGAKDIEALPKQAKPKGRPRKPVLAGQHNPVLVFLTGILLADFVEANPAVTKRNTKSKPAPKPPADNASGGVTGEVIITGHDGEINQQKSTGAPAKAGEPITSVGNEATASGTANPQVSETIKTEQEWVENYLGNVQKTIPEIALGEGKPSGQVSEGIQEERNAVQEVMDAKVRAAGKIDIPGQLPTKDVLSTLQNEGQWWSTTLDQVGKQIQDITFPATATTDTVSRLITNEGFGIGQNLNQALTSQGSVNFPSMSNGTQQSVANEIARETLNIQGQAARIANQQNTISFESPLNLQRSVSQVIQAETDALLNFSQKTAQSQAEIQFPVPSQFSQQIFVAEENYLANLHIPSGSIQFEGINPNSQVTVARTIAAEVDSVGSVIQSATLANQEIQFQGPSGFSQDIFIAEDSTFNLQLADAARQAQAPKEPTSEPTIRISATPEDSSDTLFTILGFDVSGEDLAIGSLGVLALLMGGGGGGSASFFSPPPSTSPGLDGRMSDGYINGANIWLDMNKNGEAGDVGDILVGTTDATGSILFNSQLTTALQTQASAENIALIGVGGTDISTGLTFKGSFTGLINGDTVVINPLSTLVQSFVSSGLDVESAGAQLASVLNLPSGFDLTSYDPIAGAAQSTGADASAFELQSRAAMVANLISTGVSVISGASGGESNGGSISALVVQSLVSSLQSAEESGAGFNLSDAASLQNVLTSVVSEASSNSGLTLDSALVEAAVSSSSNALAATNSVIQAVAGNVANGVDPLIALTQMVQAQMVVQGTMASTLAAGDLDSIRSAGETLSSVSAVLSAASEQVAQQVTATDTAVDTSEFTDDSVAPTVSAITLLNTANLSAGESIRINVKLTEGVFVSNGSPSLTFQIGGQNKVATFNSALSSGANLVFTYAVSTNETGSITLPASSDAGIVGGQIADVAGNMADLNFSDITFAYSVVPAISAATISGMSENNPQLIEDALTRQVSGDLDISGASVNEFRALAPGVLNGSYGNFTFNIRTGAWTYTINNAFTATNRLIEGQQVSDSLTVWSRDGTASETITVDITGANDAAVLTGYKAVLSPGQADSTYTVTKAQLLQGFVDVDADMNSDGAVDADTTLGLTVANLTADKGSVSYDQVTDNYSIIPASGASGLVTLTYQIVDGLGATTNVTNSFSLVEASVNPLTLVETENAAFTSYATGFRVEAGAQIFVSINGAVQTSTQINAKFTKTSSSGFDIYTAKSGIFVGTESVVVNGVLREGLVTRLASPLVLDPIDTTALRPTITVDNITSDNVLNNSELPESIAVTGSVASGAQAGDQISLIVNGKTLTGTVASDLSYLINVSGSDLRADSDKAIQVSVTSIDSAGNVGTASSSKSYSVSNLSPTITLNPITADNILNIAEARSTIAITGSVGGDAEAGDAILLRINNTNYSGVVAAGNTFQINVPGSALRLDADLTVEASVTARDEFGGAARASTTLTYTSDQLAPTPTITLNNVTEDNVLNLAERDSTITITGSVGGAAGNGDTVTLSVNGVNQTATVDGSNFSFNVAGTALAADADKTIQVSVSKADEAGNIGTATTSKAYSVSLSSTTPVITFNSVTADNNTLNLVESQAASVTLTGSVADANPGDTLVLRINNTSYSGVLAADRGFSIAVPGSALRLDTDRVIEASISTRDSDGNVAIGKATKSYSVDITAPTPTITLNNVTEDNVLNLAERDSTITITGSVGGAAGNGDTVTLSVNGVNQTATVDGSNFSFNVAGTALAADADKTIQVSVSKADEAGNIGTATTSKAYSVSLSSTTPVITFNSVTADNNTLNLVESQAASVTLTGSVADANPGDTLVLRINNTSYSGVLAADRGFSIAVPGSALRLDTDRVIEASISTRDSDGNVAIGKATKSYSVDITAPTPTISVAAIADDDVITYPEYSTNSSFIVSGTVAGDAVSGNTVTVSINGKSLTGAVNDSKNFSISVDKADLAADIDKAFQVSVSTSDNAGNIGTAGTSKTYTISTVDLNPTILVNDVTLDNRLNLAESRNSVLISGTVGGDALVGDAVTLRVNGTNFTGTVSASKTFAINVTGSALRSDSDNTIEASIRTVQGTDVGIGSSTKSYAVDVITPSALTLALQSDTGIVGDGISSANTVTISGVEEGATWRYSINGGGTWSDGSGSSFNLASGSYSAGSIQVQQFDLSGNPSLIGSNLIRFLIDTTRPILESITLSDSALKIGDSATVTFTFSEAVDNFTLADVVAPNGTPTDLDTDDNITWTATFTPTDAVTDLSNTISVAGTNFTDLAGNTGSGSTASSNYTVDTVRPTVTVTVADTALKIGETTSVTFAFSEAVKNFSNADLTVTNGTLSDVESTDDGVTWIATFTPTDDITDASNVITVNNAAYTDTRDNQATSNTDSNTFAIDTTRPILESITLSDSALKIGDSATVTFTFSEAVDNFTLADVVAPNGTPTDLDTDDNITWTATFTPTDAVTDLSNTISVAGTNFTDLAGNTGSGSTASSNYTVDTVRPTVTVTVADTALKIGETTSVTFAFSEAVKNFSNADLTVTNGTLSDVESTDDGVTWIATFTPTDDITDASNVITVNNAAYTDTRDNQATSNTDSNTFAIDTTRPILESITLSDSALKIGDSATVTFTFSEAVDNFTLADVVAPNGTPTDLDTDDNITWTATFTPTDAVTDLSNTISVAGTNFTDLAGNTGSGSTASSNYTVDTVRPTVTVTVADTALKIGETTSVTFAFSEAVKNFSNADLTVTNGTLSDVESTDDGVTWIATFTPTDDITDASNVITVNNAAYTDTRDNQATSNTDSNTFAIDTTRPILESITLSDSALKIGDSATVTFTFSEAVDNFTLADVVAPNGTPTDLDTDDNITWTATFTPTDAVTDLSNTISVAGTNFTDLAGNTGSGSTASSNYTVDTVRPTVTVTVADTALKIGETTSVTFAFSEAVKNFSNADLTVTNGTLSDVESTDDGVTWIATFTPTDDITDASNVITVNNAAYTDTRDNQATSNTDSNTFAIDTTRPILESITLSDSALKIGDSATVTFTFSEAVDNFTLADVVAPNGTPTDLDTDDNITWTATFTPTDAVTDLSNTISVAGTNFTDLAGNTGSGSTASSNYTVDTVRPTVTVTVADTALKIGETTSVTFAFSEAVKNFSNADLTVTNGTLSDVESTDDGVTWIATFTPTDDITDASNVITVNNAAYTDTRDNQATSNTDSNTFAIDTTRPILESITLSDSALKIGDSATVTFTFSEAVDNFTLADVVAPNGTPTDLDTDDNITWTATFTPTAGTEDYLNRITVDVNKFTDTLGNANVVGRNSSNYVVDTVLPLEPSYQFIANLLYVTGEPLATIEYREQLVSDWGAWTSFDDFEQDTSKDVEIQLRQIDQVGNISNVTQLTVEAIDQPNPPSLDLSKLISSAMIGVSVSNAGNGWQYSLDEGESYSGTLYDSELILAQTTDLSLLRFREVDSSGLRFSDSIPSDANPYSDLTGIFTPTFTSLVDGDSGTNIYVGSSEDDIVVGSGGIDLFVNFSGGDIFLGGSEGKVSISASQYQFANNYYQFEQISADDLRTVVGSLYSDAVIDRIGLRLYQSVDESYADIGFAQVERILLTDDTGLIVNELFISSKELNTTEYSGVQLSNTNWKLLAGVGDDHIFAGFGNDVIAGNGGEDVIAGGAGSDVLAGGTWEFMDTDPSSAVLWESSFANALIEGQSTQLFGEFGNDTLVALQGEVLARGEAGADTFAFFGTGENHYVNLFAIDFNAGEKIDISQIVSTGVDVEQILEDALEAKSSSDGVTTINLSALSSIETDEILLRVLDSATPQLGDFQAGVEPLWHTNLLPYYEWTLGGS